LLPSSLVEFVEVTTGKCPFLALCTIDADGTIACGADLETTIFFNADKDASVEATGDNASDEGNPDMRGSSISSSSLFFSSITHLE
jgi:hypothetical protein